MRWNPFSFRKFTKSPPPSPFRRVKLFVEQLESRVLPSVNVLSYHNDSASTGQNLSETQLTPANVNQASFGQKFSTALDGQVYAQPLIVTSVNVTTGPSPGVHDLAIVATEHDSVYAIDANTGQILWQKSFINPAAGITTVPAQDTGNTNDLTPEIGITSTPVIDSSTGTIYVEAKTKEVRNDGSHYVHTLHALSLADGTEKMGGPRVIADSIGDTYVSGPTVNGTGSANDGNGHVQFLALRQMNRPGLALVNGNIYIAYASHGDQGAYHGWILGFSAANLQPTAVFNTTPNGTEGGIWQGGGTIAADSQGNMYVETGNGDFNQSASNFNAAGFPIDGDYGDSFVKIAVDTVHNSASNQNVNGWGLKVVDYFTGFNQSGLNTDDTDLGSAAPTLLPDSVGNAAHPHLLVGSGKEGRIYLIDRDNMGKFNATTDHVVQEQASGINGSLDTAAYFNGSFYYVSGYGGTAEAFSIGNAAFSPAPTSQAAETFTFPGDTLSVSANGNSNGIVWGIDRNGNELIAYDATNLKKRLYTSNDAGSRDLLGIANKFVPPTVANGQVYVGTTKSLVMYGLTTGTTTAPTAPANLTATSAGVSQINLKWSDLSTNETGFKIERSTDGVSFNQIALASVNANNYSDTGLTAGVTYYYRVRATNAIGDSGYTNIANVSTGSPGSQVYVSDLVYTSASNGWGPVEKDMSNGENSPGDGHTITIRGQTYAKGLGTNSPSDVVYNLAGNYSNFISDLGIDDETNGSGSVNFQLYADGAKIYDSGVVTGKSAVQSVNVSVSGVQSLDLRVTDGGDGTALDHADWAGARLITASSNLPNAPSAVNGTAASGTQVNLTWTDNSVNETGFEVERSTDGANFTQIALTAANATSYMDTALTPGATYYYYLRAVNNNGESANSNTFVITMPVPPATPTGSHTTLVAPNEVDLAWIDNADNESMYRVFRKTGVGGTFNLIATLPANSTSYQDKAVAPNTQYDYHIQALNVAGASDFTGLSITTPALGSPNYLSDLTPVSATNGWGPYEKDTSNGEAAAGDGKPIAIRGQSYTKGLGVHATSDLVYTLNGAYSTFISDIGVDNETGGGGSVDFQVFADGTKIYDSGVLTGSSPVQTLNLNVNGVQSLELHVTDAGDGATLDHADWAGARLLAGVINAPSGLTATPTSATQINLTWTDNSSNETGFKVERSTDGTNYTVAAMVTANTTVYLDNGLTAGVNYYYRILASNNTGDSASSNVVNVTTPTQFTTTYVSDLAWTSASNGWGPVEKDTSNGEAAAGDGHTITIRGQSFSKGLGVHEPSDVIYNLAGNYTSFMSAVGVDDEVAGKGSVIFQVYGDGVKLYDSGVLTGTSPLQTLNVSVSGVNSLDLRVIDDGDGPSYDHADWAGARLTAGTGSTAPSAPANLTATPSSGQVALAWTASTGATSYNVYRGTASNAELSTTLTSVTSPSYTDTSLVNGTAYYYKVTAVNSSGESSRSNEATATPAAGAVTITNVSTGAAYSTTSAIVGATNYIDRNFTITAISSGLQNATLIQVANNDKYVTTASHLTISLSNAATVYVAYDARGNVLPAWLNDGTWQLSSESLSSTDTPAGPMKVYRKTFAAGSVTLGGNLQGPATGALSNYLVIVHF